MASNLGQLEARVDQLTHENAQLKQRVSADITEERQKHFAELVAGLALLPEGDDALPTPQTLSQLKEELDSAQLRINELESSRKNQDAILSRKEDELTRLYTSNNNLENTIASWRDETIRLAAERDNLATELESSKGSVDTEVALLRRQLAAKQDRELSLGDELSQKDEQLEDLRKELLSLMAGKDGDELNKLLEDKNETISSLRQKLEIAETAQTCERNVFNQKVDQLKDDLQQRVVDLSAKVQHLEARNSDLTQELNQVLPYKAQVLADPEAYPAITTTEEGCALATTTGGGNSPVEGASQLGSPTSRIGLVSGPSPNQFSTGSVSSPSFRGRVSKRARDANGRLADSAVAYEATDGPEARKQQLRLKVQQLFGGSTRQKCLDFWTEGHRRIEELEAEKQSLSTQLEQFRDKEEEMKKVLADRQKTIVSLAALTEEVQKQREELTSYRANISGLEVSNQFLTKQLHDLIGSQLSPEDLKASIDQIRDGAAAAAKASGSVLFDEGAMKKAMKEKQVLTQETAHLQRDKDKLLAFIVEREKRLESLTAQLGGRLIAHEAVQIESKDGRQQFKLGINELTMIMKELRSPYSGEVEESKSSIEELHSKQKLIECQMRIKTLQDDNAALRKEIAGSKLTVEAERAEARLAISPLEERVENLKSEANQSHSSSTALVRKNTALYESNLALNVQTKELLKGSQMVQRTAMTVVDLLGKELKISKTLRGYLATQQDRIVELEAQLGFGANDDGAAAVAAWGKVSDESARLLHEALLRHVSAMEAQLEFQITAAKKEDSLQLKIASELLQQKDTTMALQSEKAIEAYKKLSQKIDDLSKQKTLKEGMLSESQKWASKCERQLAELKMRLEEASRQQAFLGANHAKTLFSSGGAAPAGKRNQTQIPPSADPPPAYLKDLSEAVDKPHVSFDTQPAIQEESPKSGNTVSAIPARTNSAVTNATLVVNEGTEDQPTTTLQHDTEGADGDVRLTPQEEGENEAEEGDEQPSLFEQL